LLVILCILGYSALGKTFLIYLIILPNVANSFVTYNALPWIVPTSTAMTLIGHYWSLGVEEQFYSFWPWLIKKIKNLYLFLILFPIAFLCLKVFAKLMNFSEPIQYLLHYSRFGCLAIGAIGAYIFWKKPLVVNFMTNFYLQIVMWLFFALLVFNKFHIFSIIDHEIVSMFVVMLILGQISTRRKVISLENKVFDYLGKISFGIYVYNPLAIFLLYSASKKYFTLSENFLYYTILFLIVAFLNIALAHVSYFTLEKYFLTWKKRFVTIKSAASRQESNEN
jgi:peptidoglycan/LPS O-acetylase OafA/YrhL